MTFDVVFELRIYQPLERRGKEALPPVQLLHPAPPEFGSRSADIAQPLDVLGRLNAAAPQHARWR